MVTYVWRNGDLVEKSMAELRDRKNPAPNIISDNMPMLKHHGSGQMIDSKRKFSKTTRELGLTEIGNEMPKPRQPVKLDKRDRVNDIQKTIYDLRNGRG